MPKLFSDRTKETSTSTGTGNITLLGAVAQHQAFSNTYLVQNSNIPYAIVGQSGTEWETGNCTMLTSTTFSRDSVVASSNNNALVNFSAGTKDVFVTLHGQDANQLTMIGLALAFSTNIYPIF